MDYYITMESKLFDLQKGLQALHGDRSARYVG